MIKALVFPCGSEIGLEIHNALRFVKNVELYGAGSVDDHGPYVYKNYIPGVPFVNDAAFLPIIRQIVEKYDIQYIFPAHDEVVRVLGMADAADIGAEVITSDRLTCELARSKKRTYQHLAAYDFVPTMYEPNEVPDEAFPVFLKPDVGQGSTGIAVAKTRQEMIEKMTHQPGLIICELLPGDEYTVDCFTNRHRELIFVGQRKRARVKSGISVKSISVELDEQVAAIANVLNDAFQFRGAWFFQVKRAADGRFKLLEIAPRIAGTMSLYRNRGINFPLMGIFDREGYDVQASSNGFNITIDRALINRFHIEYPYERVYIDFDDTVTLGDKVNPVTMQFIYQCQAKGKELILITRHATNIYETLGRLNIHTGLFKEIIHLDRSAKKSAYIKTEVPTIFIDDSFVERKDVAETKEIPVFDIDAIESLLDWRY